MDLKLDLEREAFSIAARLAELASDLGLPSRDRIVELFLRASGKTCRGLTADLERGDSVQLRRAFHSLAGSFANVGAIQTAALCRALENEVAEGGPETLPSSGHGVSEVQARFSLIERILATLVRPAEEGGPRAEP